MKALKTKLRDLSKLQFTRLKGLTHHSKNLYNQALWVLCEAFEATRQYFTYPQLDKAIKEMTRLLHQINLGKKTNQNFVNLALGQFLDKLRYKLELHGISINVYKIVT